MYDLLKRKKQHDRGRAIQVSFYDIPRRNRNITATYKNIVLSWDNPA